MVRPLSGYDQRSQSATQQKTMAANRTQGMWHAEKRIVMWIPSAMAQTQFSHVPSPRTPILNHMKTNVKSA